MDDDRLSDAIAWLVCGFSVGVFVFIKIGGGSLLVGSTTASEVIIQQTRMEAAAVDLATFDEQRPVPLESHVPASKSDRPE